MMSVGNLTAFLVSLPLLYQKHVLLFAVDSRWWNVVFALPVASSCFILLLFTYIYPLDSPLYYYFIQDQRSVIHLSNSSLKNLYLTCSGTNNWIVKLREYLMNSASQPVEFNHARLTVPATSLKPLWLSQASFLQIHSTHGT